MKPWHLHKLDDVEDFLVALLAKMLRRYQRRNSEGSEQVVALGASMTL